MWKGAVVAYFKVILTPFLHKIRKAAKILHAVILSRIFYITTRSAKDVTFLYCCWNYCKEKVM